MARAIVFFDGLCNLCTWSVQFIIDRDPTAYFQFASIQSTAAQRILADYQQNRTDMGSVVLIEDGRVYLFSDAALRIAQRLSGWWRLCVLFQLFPQPVRDWGYQLIAGNRYRLFGKRTTCWIPTQGLQHRFLT